MAQARRGPSRWFTPWLIGMVLALGFPYERGGAAVPVPASPAAPPLPYVAVNGAAYTTVAWDHAGRTVHLYIYQVGTGGVWATATASHGAGTFIGALTGTFYPDHGVATPVPVTVQVPVGVEGLPLGDAATATTTGNISLAATDRSGKNILAFGGEYGLSPTGYGNGPAQAAVFAVTRHRWDWLYLLASDTLRTAYTPATFARVMERDVYEGPDPLQSVTVTGGTGYTACVEGSLCLGAPLAVTYRAGGRTVSGGGAIHLTTQYFGFHVTDLLPPPGRLVPAGRPVTLNHGDAYPNEHYGFSVDATTRAVLDDGRGQRHTLVERQAGALTLTTRVVTRLGNPYTALTADTVALTRTLDGTRVAAPSIAAPLTSPQVFLGNDNRVYDFNRAGSYNDGGDLYPLQSYGPYGFAGLGPPPSGPEPVGRTWATSPTQDLAPVVTAITGITLTAPLSLAARTAITSLAVVQGATMTHLAGTGAGHATVTLSIAGMRVRAVMTARATLSAMYGIAAADGAPFPYPVRAGAVDERFTLTFNAEGTLPHGLPARITLDRRVTLASS